MRRLGIRVLLVALLALALFPLAATPGWAKKYPPQPTVQPTRIERPSEPEVEGEILQKGGLPVTGAQLTGIVIVGAGAIGTGTVLVRRSRRRSNN